jgi:hypothetical protein
VGTRSDALRAAAIVAARKAREFACSTEYHHQLLADLWHREYEKLRDAWLRADT